MNIDWHKVPHRPWGNVIGFHLEAFVTLPDGTTKTIRKHTGKGNRLRFYSCDRLSTASVRDIPAWEVARDSAHAPWIVRTRHLGKMLEYLGATN